MMHSVLDSWFIFIFHWIVKITTCFLLKIYSQGSRENTFNMFPRRVYKIMKYRNGNHNLITLFVCSVVSMSMLITGSICFSVVWFFSAFIYIHFICILVKQYVFPKSPTTWLIWLFPMLLAIRQIRGETPVSTSSWEMMNGTPWGLTSSPSSGSLHVH